MLAIANDNKTPVAVRIGALAAVPGGLAKVEPAHFAPSRQPGQRSAGRRPLRRRRGARESEAVVRELLALADMLKTAGPMEVERLLEAYGTSTDEAVGLALLASLKDSTSRAASAPMP